MNVQLREVTSHDVAALRPLFQAFHEAARLPGQYDVGVEWRLADMLDAETGLVIFAAYDGDRPVGVIGGTVLPDLFTQTLTASELFWYTDPAVRGTGTARALFEAFERYAVIMDAKRIHMMALEHLDADRVGLLYQRKGYSRREILWEKQV